jgi:hypothetical protein
MTIHKSRGTSRSQVFTGYRKQIMPIEIYPITNFYRSVKAT